MGLLSLRYTEALITRFGARRLLFPGFALILTGLLLFTRTPVDGNYWVDVLPVMVLIGTGVGLSFPALMTIAMSGVKPEEAGLASGLVNTSMQVGAALGLAVLATVSASRTETLTGQGDSLASALTGGYHLAFGIAAALVLVAIGVAALVLKSDDATERAPAREPEPAPAGC